MPYDTIVAAESTQNNGYAGVAGKGPAPYAFTGDTVTLFKGRGIPYVVGLGSTSLTKPQGCRIKGNRSYSTQYFVGPGGLMFGTGGNPMLDIAVPFQEGEILTFEAGNTNVAESTIVYADIAYGGVHPYPTSIGAAVAAAGGGELWSVPYSATAAAAVTPAIVGALDAMTTDTGDLWLDTEASYHIIGTQSSIGVAGGSGLLYIVGLGGEWQGKVPAIPTSGLHAAFETQGLNLAYEPIPFDGDALPSYMVAQCTAAAQIGSVLLVKHSASG